MQFVATCHSLQSDACSSSLLKPIANAPMTRLFSFCTRYVYSSCLAETLMTPSVFPYKCCRKSVRTYNLVQSRSRTFRVSMDSKIQVVEGDKEAMDSSPRKVFKSAVCIIPPESLWEPIQTIRQKHDKHFMRWPPHINLLYPFWEDDGTNFELASSKATEALEHLPPFSISLNEFKYFNHGRSCTVWLDPFESSDSFRKMKVLQKELVKTFPECNEFTEDTFTPHLSVGQWRNSSEAERAIEKFSENWEPISFSVEDFFLISRRGFHDPFHRRFSIPLSASERKLSPQLITPFRNMNKARDK